MKTTDLIPILLYELKDGDKYGLEIVEAIKSASKGQIEIKQATLYPLLKKLEKSKFISSFWQDSEIGGKRHYYKITENGLAQLDTYPPLEELISNALIEENEEVLTKSDSKLEDESEENSNSPSDEHKTFNPFDNIFTVSNEAQDLETKNEIYPKYSIDNDFSHNKNFGNSTEISNKLADVDEQMFNTNNIDFNKTEQLNDDSEITYNIKNEIPDANKINDQKNDIDENYTSNYISNIETFEDKNAQLESKNDKLNVFDQLHFEDSPIYQNNDNDLQETKNATKEIDIFSALSFSDENEIIKSENNTIENKNNDCKSVNNSNGSTSLQENPEELVLDNPFFKENNQKTLSEKTNLEINEDNAKLLSKDENKNNFATEKSVKRFTEKPIAPANDFIQNKTKNLFETPMSFPIEPKTNTVNSDVEYRDYIDYKNDKKILHSKKVAKMKFLKLTSSSLIALILLVTFLIICIKIKITPLFVLLFIGYTLYIVLNFCRFMGNYKTIRLKLDTPENFYNFKNQILIRSITFVVIAIALLIINLVGIKQGGLFSAKNFGNFLAPIIVASMLFVDYLLSYIFYKVLLK